MLRRPAEEWLPRWVQDADVQEAKQTVTDFVHGRPMTKHERAALVGYRANQLSYGASERAVVNDGSGSGSGSGSASASASAARAADGSSADQHAPLKVAAAEVDTGVLSGYHLIRYLPDGTAVQLHVPDVGLGRVRDRLW
jgi:DNA-directed RNA polymerase subunit K/omega